MADVPLWVYAIAPPLWVLGATYVVRTVRFWPELMARWNERQRDKEAAKDGDWSRLRGEVTRLAQRVKILEDEKHQTQADRDHWKSRAIVAEAIVQGQGEVRQQAAGVVASDRLARRAEEGDGHE